MDAIRKTAYYNPLDTPTDLTVYYVHSDGKPGLRDVRKNIER